jgi:hypothetical protein
MESTRMSRETLYVGVAKFSGIDGAERAFADAHDRDPAADWMADAAFVGVARDGRIVVRGSVAGHYVDLDGEGDVIGPDTGKGAVAGAVIGFPLGPSAFAVGLVGGATVGGVIEASHLPRLEARVRRDPRAGAQGLVGGRGHLDR